MPDNNQFQPYRYQQAENGRSHAPLHISASAGPSYSDGPGPVGRLFRRPAFATATLLIGAAVLAGVFMFSYPSGDDGGALPIVQADATLIRELPESIGGMEIPNADSTIFQTARVDQVEPPPVENLLADEEPVNKLEAFAEEAKALMESAPSSEEVATTQAEAAAAGLASETGKDAAKVEKVIRPKIEMSAVPRIKPKIFERPAPAEASVKTEQAFKPGSSPETLAFVRSVLDKKDVGGSAPSSSKRDAAKIVKNEAISQIQPSSGTAGPSITPGNYFVQLGSVTSQTGAHSEWKKIQKEFSQELSSADYRVKTADLGEKGTYYRIQAGPMSKSSASDVCNMIKARKPGACLVTQ